MTQICGKIYSIPMSANYFASVVSIIKNNPQIEQIFLPNRRSKRALKEMLKASDCQVPELIVFSDIFTPPNLDAIISEFLFERTKTVPFNRIFGLAHSLSELICNIVTNGSGYKNRDANSVTSQITNTLFSLYSNQPAWKHIADIISAVLQLPKIQAELNNYLNKLSILFDHFSLKYNMILGISETNDYILELIKQTSVRGILVFEGLENKESLNYKKNKKLLTKINFGEEKILTVNISRTTEKITELAEFKNISEEGLAIAIAIRKAVYENLSVLVVCPSADLSRKIKHELSRWNICINDSLGNLFSQSPSGQIITKAINMLKNNFSNFDVINFLKSSSALRNVTFLFEKYLKTSNEYFPNFFENYEKFIQSANFSSKITENFQETIDKLKKFQESTENRSFKEWINYFCELISLINSNCCEDFSLVINKFEFSKFPSVSLEDFLMFVHNYVLTKTINDKKDYTSNISLVGIIEAQLLDADFTIIAEANEESWTASNNNDFWMSNSLLHKFNVSTSEDNSEFYLCILERLLQKNHILITRSKNVDSRPVQISPCVSNISYKSAIWLTDFVHQARKADHNVAYEFTVPSPPLEFRPTTFYVSQFEQLIHNPYAFYARRVLKLPELFDIDNVPQYIILGNFIHKVLQRFVNESSDKNDENLLKQILYEEKDKSALQFEAFGLWRFHIENICKFIVQNLSNDISYYTEISGEAEFTAIKDDKKCEYVIRCRADRLDVDNQGDIRVIDYKTGEIPTKTELANEKIQVPTEMLIAYKNGFPIKYSQISAPQFWQLKAGKLSKKDMSEYFGDFDVERSCQEIQRKINDLIVQYNIEGIGYNVNKDDDHGAAYVHLSRIKESKC